MTESENDTFSKFTQRFVIVASKLDMFVGKKDRIMGVTKDEEYAKKLVEKIKEIDPNFSTIEIMPIFWEE